VPALAPQRVGETHVPAARELAACVLTLPLHGGLRGTLRERAIEVLAAAGRGRS